MLSCSKLADRNFEEVNSRNVARKVGRLCCSRAIQNISLLRMPEPCSSAKVELTTTILSTPFRGFPRNQQNSQDQSHPRLVSNGVPLATNLFQSVPLESHQSRPSTIPFHHHNSFFPLIPLSLPLHLPTPAIVLLASRPSNQIHQTLVFLHCFLVFSLMNFFCVPSTPELLSESAQLSRLVGLVVDQLAIGWVPQQRVPRIFVGRVYWLGRRGTVRETAAVAQGHELCKCIGSFGASNEGRVPDLRVENRGASALERGR